MGRHDFSMLVGVAILVMLSIQGTQASSDVILNGCTGSYLHLQCPDDEHVNVKDVDIQDSGSSGSQCQGEDMQPPIPSDLAELCEDDCPYESDICKDEQECVFYISPRSLGSKSSANQLRVSYECEAGTGKQIGMIILIIIGVVAFIIFAVLIVMLVRRHWQEAEEDYKAFANISRTSSVRTLEGQRENNNDGAAATPPAVGYQKKADPGDEHVTVNLEAPGTHETVGI